MQARSKPGEYRMKPTLKLHELELKFEFVMQWVTLPSNICWKQWYKDWVEELFWQVLSANNTWNWVYLMYEWGKNKSWKWKLIDARWFSINIIQISNWSEWSIWIYCHWCRYVGRVDRDRQRPSYQRWWLWFDKLLSPCQHLNTSHRFKSTPTNGHRFT